MPVPPTNLFQYVRPGMVLEVRSPDGSAVCTVVSADASHLVAVSDTQPPPPGRVFVRVPTDGGLVQVTARLSPAGGGDAFVRLDAVSSVLRRERRGTRRLREPVRVSVQMGDESAAPRILPAINLSTRGLLLGWPQRPEAVLGEQLGMTITLGADAVETTGEVLRTDDCHTAIRFVGIADDVRDRIDEYVLRRTRLVDDEAPWLGDEPVDEEGT